MQTKLKYRSCRLLTAAAALLFAALLMTGCSVSMKVTLTQRSSIEQRLLARSLERALVQMDTSPFKGKRLTLDVYGLTADREFAKEFLLARLREQGLHFVADKKPGEIQLKIFLTALGVDRAEHLVGIPAVVTPVIDAPLPEIAFFKSVHNRGHVEIQLYAFDEDSGDFITKSTMAVGNAKYDDYTILIFVNFTLDDLDEPPASPKEKVQP